MVVTAKFWTIPCVGATKSPGAILNASPEGVRHMDMPNNSFAHWWQHGYSTERDFIYITTASLTHEQLQQLSDEVGPKRSLLVLCTAFRARAEYLNLTVKKIPKQVLSRCEWGHDDYSLQVENLPTAPHPSPLPEGEGIIKMALPQAGEGIEINGRMDVKNKSKPRVKKTDGMDDLFGGDA